VLSGGGAHRGHRRRLEVKGGLQQACERGRKLHCNTREIRAARIETEADETGLRPLDGGAVKADLRGSPFRSNVALSQRKATNVGVTGTHGRIGRFPAPASCRMATTSRRSTDWPAPLPRSTRFFGGGRVILVPLDAWRSKARSGMVPPFRPVNRAITSGRGAVRRSSTFADGKIETSRQDHSREVGKSGSYGRRRAGRCAAADRPIPPGWHQRENVRLAK